MKTIADIMPPGQNFRMIFYFLNQLSTYSGVPWKSENISAMLDQLYVFGVSGQKTIAPLVEAIMSGETLNTQEYQLLANMAWNLYHESWKREWDTLSLQYAPIENYSMTEEALSDKTEVEYGKKTTRTPNLSEKKTGDDTLTPTTETKQTNKVAGFNSSTLVTSGESTVLGVSGTNKTTYNNTLATTGSDASEDSGKDTTTHTYKFKRTGNIGVTTSQQMLESERNVWRWNYFREIVFPDLDKLFALMVYA